MVTLRKQSDSWKTFVLEVQLTVNKKYFSRLPTAYRRKEKIMKKEILVKILENFRDSDGFQFADPGNLNIFHFALG